LTTSSGAKTDNQSEKNSSSSDSNTGNPEKSSNETLGTNGALVSDAGSIRQKPDPDDYSKPQTRVCSYKECGKTFTIPLDGDNGTLWSMALCGTSFVGIFCLDAALYASRTARRTGLLSRGRSSPN
jgi:hypothetical protein